MNPLEVKMKLAAVCRVKLLETISSLEAAMADLQQQANDYGPPKDRYDSFRSQLLRRKDMMAQQLDKEMNELKTLEKIDMNKANDKAGFGTLVFTPEQNYFISIGLGKIELDGSIYYAISPIVPLSLAINGKKKGETAEFRGNTLKILDVV